MSYIMSWKEDENSALLPLQVTENIPHSTTVFFSLDDDLVKMEMTDIRPKNINTITTINNINTITTTNNINNITTINSDSLTSLASITEFNKTMAAITCIRFTLIFSTLLVIGFLWWANSNDTPQEHPPLSLKDGLRLPVSLFQIWGNLTKVLIN